MATAKRKLQVFVSSTYLDLIAERQAAVQAILSAGHIPAGMELFAAGDESQWKVIQRWIDESDVYMLILGTRYGSIDVNTGKSYTQLEYEYAVDRGKPLFACVIDEKARDARIKAMGIAAIDDQGVKLKEFRDGVLMRMSGYWSDTKDIALTVHQSMGEFERQENLKGWVKGDQAVDPLRMEQMAQEIARLSAENHALRGRSLNKPVTTFLGLSYDEAKARLTKTDNLESFSALREVADEFSAINEMNQDQIRELRDLGLIENNRGLTYTLTWEGRAFLNMYTAEQDRNA